MQKKQMKDMMKGMGMEIDDDEFNEEDEMKAIMKDLGVNDDPENMDDDAILAELDRAEITEKIQQARNLKETAETLKT
jgi:ribosomal protein L12E/L44/L45/RPP1/RPP2